MKEHQKKSLTYEFFSSLYFMHYRREFQDVRNRQVDFCIPGMGTYLQRNVNSDTSREEN